MANWLGAAVSGVGSLLGFGSNASTNKTNLKIAQMNNEFNERMLQKQMDYNTEMWNKENEYNSASAQRQRLEDAGMNPYMMMNGGSAGVASSAGGVTPPTADTSGRQTPYNWNLDGMGASMQAALDLQERQRVNDAQIDHVRADARLKGIEQMTKLMDAYSNARTSKSRAALDDTIRETNKMMQGINYKNAEADLQQKTVNNLLLSKELSIFDEKNRVALSNQISDTLLKNAQRGLTKQQQIHEIQKMIETTARTSGIKISNDVAKRSANSLVEKAYQDSMPNSPWNLLSRGYRDIGTKFNLW